jgi:pyridoxal 5'-phosphate synthase pdxT subunit
VAGSSARQTVGVLALQGGVDLHKLAFSALGCQVVEVRQPKHLVGVDRLVIPGGESTALLKLMQPWDFLSVIREYQSAGNPILGTCAGAILLAQTVLPEQESLQLMDITVERNAYGRQIDSFVAEGSVVDAQWAVGPIPLAFIRAPKICLVGSQARVLVTHQDDPVLVQQGNCLAATFHPEATQSNFTVLRYFMSL